MLYGKYMPGRKFNYVILEWKNQGHACSFWVSLYTALDIVVEELLVNFMSCGGEVCGGGGPSGCSNLKHDRKNTCQTPSKPCLLVTCEIEILTLFAGWRPLVLLENWVVLGPWVCEKQQSSLMSREMPSFLCVTWNCGVKSIILKGDVSTDKWTMGDANSADLTCLGFLTCKLPCMWGETVTPHLW